MKIVAFSGGLGNQIFEYANYQRLQQLYPEEQFFGFYPKTELKDHNGLEIEKHFEIKLPSVSKLSNVIGFILLFVYRLTKRINIHPSFVSDRLHKNDRALFHTGWFGDKTNIPNGFAISFKIGSISAKNVDLLNLISSTSTVSIHIRRGDFMSESNKKLYGDICTQHYYETAISKILEQDGDVTFIVFSDDTEYARTQFAKYNAIIVDWNKNSDAYMDMYLMSKCDYMIIANSTFSYWAARFNDKAKGIFCPSIWLNGINVDIYPDNWTRIEI